MIAIDSPLGLSFSGLSSSSYEAAGTPLSPGAAAMLASMRLYGAQIQAAQTPKLVLSSLELVAAQLRLSGLRPHINLALQQARLADINCNPTRFYMAAASLLHIFFDQKAGITLQALSDFIKDKNGDITVLAQADHLGWDWSSFEWLFCALRSLNPIPKSLAILRDSMKEIASFVGVSLDVLPTAAATTAPLQPALIPEQGYHQQPASYWQHTPPAEANITKVEVANQSPLPLPPSQGIVPHPPSPHLPSPPPPQAPAAPAEEPRREKQREFASADDMPEYDSELESDYEYRG